MTSEKNNAGSDGAVECGDKDRDEILQTIGEAIGKLEAGEAVEIPKVRPQEAQFDSGRHFMPRSTVNWSVSRDCGRRFLALLRSIEDILNGGEKVLQRDHFYRLGSNYDAFKDDGPLADPYEALTGNYIRRIEGLTGAERQNLGLLGGGRGYIWSPRGRMSTTKRKDVDLADAPAIRNDIRRSTLVDAPDIVVSVEKPGVQEVLENSGIAEVLDFMVVVPRGRTNRAALRFLKERERDGKRIFSLNDGDVVGLKIPLEMKGLSKRGAHLGDDFRPNVDHIGVYGRALSHAGIDGITENNMNKLEDGLVKARNLGKDRILAELKNIERTGKRWETAALDPYDKGLETYLIEAFRAFGVYDDRLFDPDEISPKTVRGKVPDLIWEHIETRGDIDAGNLAGETLCKREGSS